MQNITKHSGNNNVVNVYPCIQESSWNWSHLLIFDHTTSPNFHQKVLQPHDQIKTKKQSILWWSTDNFCPDPCNRLLFGFTFHFYLKHWELQNNNHKYQFHSDPDLSHFEHRHKTRTVQILFQKKDLPNSEHPFGPVFL